MAHRHKVHKKNVGGATPYNAATSNVVHEAEEKGAKHGGKVHGHKGHHRKFARGGHVGSDKSPFSSAHVAPHQPGGNPHPHGLGKTHSGG